jgi:carbon storage regulator
MLVLTRKLNETIIIDGNIRITVVAIQGHKVRLGIDAPASVGILREELCVPAPTSDRREGPMPASAGGRT